MTLQKHFYIVIFIRKLTCSSKGTIMSMYIPFRKEEVAFLGNFFYHFRFGDESGCPEGIWRTCVTDVWNTTHREIYEGRACLFKDHFSEVFGKLSDKYLNQTPSDFYGEVDSTIIELGLDSSVISKKIKNFVAIPSKLKPKNALELSTHTEARALTDYLVIIYIALRKKGYNPFDLRTGA